MCLCTRLRPRRVCAHGSGKYIAPGLHNHQNVTQSRAVGHEFCLSLKDISVLTYECVRNPHYRSAAPMKLYNVGELRRLALKKYGSVKGARVTKS